MPRIIITGDAQAEALAEILGTMRSVTANHDVVYSATPDLSVMRGDTLFVQRREEPPIAGAKVKRGARVITFPHLHFELLWPLSCINPFDKPEPGFPHGRFPYGDSYVVNCVRSETPPDEILGFYQTERWPSTWPNLNRLFQAESARLAAIDAASDVKIGSFILKRFRTERLFHNANAPSDVLLHELAARLASVVSAEVPANTATPRARGTLATIEVPIHPAVAAHFHLEWYAPDLRYAYFDQAPISSDEYFRRLIAQSYLNKSDSGTALIIYGNCQAQALASVLQLAGRGDLRVLYLRSFDEPGAAPAALSPSDVTRCALLWEQHDDQHPFPYREWLPPSCRIVKFPAADFNALWPLTCVNPHAHPNPPAYPFGQFPYGDRAVLECLDEIQDADGVWECYERISPDRMPDLERFLALEAARLKARDAKCDVKIADYILAEFRTRRLFWTVNHPSTVLLAELADRLLRISGDFPPLHSVNTSRILEQRFDAAGPLGVCSVPIHPFVASHYGLKWYNAAKETFQNWGDRYTYEGYFRALIASSLKIAQQA